MWYKLRMFLLAVTPPIIIALIFALSCSPVYNRPVPINFEAFKQGHDENIQDDATLVFAAFSGGGTKSAAMCWETLKEFKKIPYIYLTKDGDTVRSNLANEIDYVSGVSGGSFAAAGWCLFKDSMDVFEDRFINKNLELEFIKYLLWPHRLIRLSSPKYNRINVVSEYYHNKVFNKSKFKDIPDYPTLWINSTILSLGLRFTYDHEHFCFIGSDINSYPIGLACAASSAFPVLLNPITLRNYGTTEQEMSLLMNPKYRSAKRNSSRNLEKYLYAKKVEFFNDKRNKWIHLADGGLVDNQGLQVILDQFSTNGIINKRINGAVFRPLKRLVFINVKAGYSPDDNSCEYESPPKSIAVVKYATTISMNRLSSKRWEEIKLRSRDKKALIEANGLTFETPYFIEINFRNIRDDKLREKCMGIETSFSLSDEKLALIRKTIPVLINENKDLKRLKKIIREVTVD